MAIQAGRQPRSGAGARRALGYRSVVVPVAEPHSSDRALVAAGRLAADRGAEITVVSVLEVPFDLPLDSLLDDEEHEARELLRRAQAAVERFGVDTTIRLLRARDAAEAIVELATDREADLIVLGARRRPSRRGRTSFGKTARAILEDATCRVLVVSAPA